MSERCVARLRRPEEFEEEVLLCVAPTAWV